MFAYNDCQQLKGWTCQLEQYFGFSSVKFATLPNAHQGFHGSRITPLGYESYLNLLPCKMT